MITADNNNPDKELERVEDFITQRLSDIEDKLTDMKPVQQPQREIAPDLRVWIDQDPLLAELHRDLIAASNHLRTLPMRRASDDPMLEVLTLERDSAKSRFEARLIELRQKFGAVGAWYLIQKRAEYEEQANRWREEEERHKMLMREKKELRKARRALKKKRNKDGILTWLLIGMGITCLLGRKSLTSFYNSQSHGLKHRFAKQNS